MYSKIGWGDAIMIYDAAILYEILGVFSLEAERGEHMTSIFYIVGTHSILESEAITGLLVSVK